MDCAVEQLCGVYGLFLSTALQLDALRAQTGLYVQFASAASVKCLDEELAFLLVSV